MTYSLPLALAVALLTLPARAEEPRSSHYQLRCASDNGGVNERVDPGSEKDSIGRIRVKFDPGNVPVSALFVITPLAEIKWAKVLDISFKDPPRDEKYYKAALGMAGMAKLVEREVCEGPLSVRKNILELLKDNRFRGGFHADFAKEDERFLQRQPDPARAFKPVVVKCPARNEGVYEEYFKNASGQYKRLRVTFDAAGMPRSVALALEEADGTKEEYMNFELFGTPTVGAIISAGLLEEMAPWKQHLCDARSPRTEELLKQLKANRAQLGIN